MAKTRDELINDLRTLREEIRLAFEAAAHWNRTHPAQEPLNPDPGGELADMASQIDDILATDPGHGPLRTLQLRNHAAAKVIAFVDFDGVLNTADSWGRRGTAALDPVLVKVLDDFCREAGAAVVVTSTWRQLYPLEQLREMLAAAGLSAPVVGVTPVLHDKRRFEIKNWLSWAPGRPFVIFDDDHDADMAGHFVHVGGSRGLTRDHTARAAQLLVEQAEDLTR